MEPMKIRLVGGPKDGQYKEYEDGRELPKKLSYPSRPDHFSCVGFDWINYVLSSDALGAPIFKYESIEKSPRMIKE